MHDLANRVMELQREWTHKNTPPMQERGLIIRNAIPLWLDQCSDRLKAAMGLPATHFNIEGRDGTGRKTRIPWVRFYSKAHSPRATEGWYCVYLFEAQGDCFYLALAHGSTRFIDGEFKPRGDEELGRLVSWANGLLRDDLGNIPNAVRTIHLGEKTKLGQAYAKSTVAALRYRRDHLPSDEQFARDAEKFAALLGKLYGAWELGRASETPIPQPVAPAKAVGQVTNPLRKGGQGLGLSAEERKVVEHYAMVLAARHLRHQGFETKDVSRTESFDILATKLGHGDLYVEVKGTTAGPDSVVLTTAEVALNKRQYPHTALIIVHGITLQRRTSPPTAADGSLLVISPWIVEDAALSPLSFRYSVPIEKGHQVSTSSLPVLPQEP